MNILLSLDTTDSSITQISISKDGEKRIYTLMTDHTKSQNVLPLIETALQKEKIALTDLSAIEVHTGPGSFTGVRVGIAVANTLAWLLKIPVNGKQYVEPIYEPSKFD